MDALLSNQATFQKLGGVLPIHNGSHPIYNAQTNGQLQLLRASIPNPTPLQARTIFDTVAMANRVQILSGVWHPRVN